MQENEEDKLSYIKWDNINDEYCSRHKLVLTNECNICLEKFEKDHVLVHTKCNHLYHKDCIIKWLKEYSVKCPICKIKIMEGKPVL